MLTAGGSSDGLWLPNTLTLTPNHTAAVVGHLLRKLYSEELETEREYPDRLRPLVEQLQARGRQEATQDA